MNVLGRVAQGVFGQRQLASDGQEDDSLVESLLHQISDSRHAEDRRDAMSQLKDLLHDNQSAQLAMGTMGLPVILAVLQEDRDDLELLKGALEVLQLTVALPESATAASKSPTQQQQDLERSPPPALINADLYCRSPDNVLLLLGLLRDEPEGIDDFYVRYGAMQAMSGLLAACPDKFQSCVLSSPTSVTTLCDLLASSMEVVRNEALLLLVGLCNGCPQVANIAAFEGAFEKLLVICGSEGGPSAGDVVIQDATELMNNLLRDNLANQRLFREMGHISQLPRLLQFTHPPPPAATAAGMIGSASQFVDPSLRAAAGAAAAAAASTAVGAAAAAAVAAAGAAAAVWPTQVAANYLCLLETARLLLAPPHATSEEQRSQEDANRRANQDKLGQLGLLGLLAKLAADGGGAPSAAVRAQALFCIGDLVHSHAQLQEQLYNASVMVPLAAAAAAPVQQQHRPPSFLPPVGPPTAGSRPGMQKSLPLLQVALQVALHAADGLERAGAAHLLAGFCASNPAGQTAVLHTVAATADPHTFGEELCAALLCMQPAVPASPPVVPFMPAGASGVIPSLPQGSSVLSTQAPAAVNPLDLQLQAGRAAVVLGHFLSQNPTGQCGMLGLQVSETPGDTLLPRCVRLLSEGARRADGKTLPTCYSVLRLLITWCAGCSAAVSSLLAAPSHLPLLVDLTGGRMAAGDVHTAGLAAVLLGVCLMSAPGSPLNQQQQQQQQADGAAAAAAPQQPPAAVGTIRFDQLLDVLISRVGLSQFFGAIDDMRASRAYQAAKAAPRLPARITRSGAAAVLEAESSAGGSGGGAWGLVSAAAGAGKAAAAGQVLSQDVQPCDYALTQMVDQVTEAVQQLTLNAFAGSGSSSSTSPAAAAAVPASTLLPQLPPAAAHASGGAGAAGGVGAAEGAPAPWKPGQQQQQQPGAAAAASHPQSPSPIVSNLANNTAAAAGSGVTSPGKASAAGIAAISAQLKGDTAEQRLDSALHMILHLQGSCAELQSRNRSLAEDLIRLSQSKPHLTTADALTDGAGAGGPHVPSAANGVAGCGPKSGSGDVESRVALQLRASRAEMDAGTVRQQLAAMQQQWSSMDRQVAAAHAAAEEARAAAAKADADLTALSAAYNDLEAHAFGVEEQLRQLQQQGAAATSTTAAAAGGSDAKVDASTQTALEQDQQQQQQHSADAAAGSSADMVDVESRLAAAAAEARAAAEAAAEEEMEDLLACLGEEQAKVEVLSLKLIELGEDVDKLLKGIAEQQEDAETADTGEQRQATEDAELL